MTEKINYNKKMMEQIANLPKGETKPRLLLHVCCAPCSSAVLERLARDFDILLFFDNPNLDTGEEFDRRAEEARRLALDTGWAKEVLIVPYDPKTYLDAVKGHEEEREGGERCRICFRLRLSRSAEAAVNHQCDYFTTTLTISPRKNAAVLNEIGQEAGERAGIPFLPSDFKKEGGYPRSIELSREYDLYRQDYCGCVFSKEERLRQQQAKSLNPSSDN